jgi:hypothetical protein
MYLADLVRGLGRSGLAEAARTAGETGDTSLLMATMAQLSR